MFTIKKATTNDIQLINEMAQIVFPATYREILSKEQLDYMMDWMYSPKNLNPEKPDVPLNKNDAFQKVQKRRVQEKR